MDSGRQAENHSAVVQAQNNHIATDSNFLILHWEKQLKIFFFNLGLLKQKSNSNAIHDWRVAVKKLRSYLKLYFLLIVKEPGKKELKETEKLFRLMGKQRDIEMNLQFLESLERENDSTYPFLCSYLNYAHTSAERRSWPVLKTYKTVEIENLADQMKKHFSTISPAQIENRANCIIKNQLEKIKELLKETNKTNAHLLRKRMKDLNYWTSAFHHFVMTSEQLKKLNTILDRLGNWHDTEVLLMKIRHFRQDMLAKETVEYDTCRLLENQSKEKSRKYLNKAEKSSKELFKKIE